MSVRLRRQELRRAAEHSRENSQNSAPKSAGVTIKSANPRTHSKSAFSVKTQADGSSLQSTDLGLPSRESYTRLEDDYITSLSVRKQEKALLTQEMFDLVWDVLHDPDACKLGTPQFRWWVRKMFVLAHTAPNGPDADLKPVVLHEDRPVVVKEQIYDVLSYCHLLSNHGGRDRTTAVVKEHYSWVPKELVARFVKACPTCVFKRTGSVELSYPSECTNIVPFSAAQTDAIAMQSSDGPAVTGASASSPWGDPAHAAAASRKLVHPAVGISPFTLPPLRTLFPNHVVSSGSSSMFCTHGSSSTASWLTSLATQTVASASAPMRPDNSHNAPGHPELPYSGPALPPLIALSSSSGSSASQGDPHRRSSLASPPLFSGGHDHAEIPDSSAVDCGSAADSSQEKFSTNDAGVMAIDPALLSEDAHTSQLHNVIYESLNHSASRQAGKGKLNDYLYVPPLGRYTVEDTVDVE